MESNYFINTLFFEAYNDIYDENAHTPDVILKIGPEKTEYYTHRLVLVAVSDFLRMILFETNPGTLPVILLPDVSEAVIDYILYFIYHGEVQVPQEIYQTFVDTCELLQLKHSGTTMDEQSIASGATEQIPIQPEIMSQNQIEVVEPMDAQLDEPEIKPKLEELPILTKVIWKPDRNKLTNEKRKQNLVRNIKDTKENRKSAQEKLTNTVKFVYESHRIPTTEEIDANIKNSSLFIENQRIVCGVHSCGLCGRKIRIFLTYNKNTGSICFINSNLVKHMRNVHT